MKLLLIPILLFLYGCADNTQSYMNTISSTNTSIALAEASKSEARSLETQKILEVFRDRKDIDSTSIILFLAIRDLTDKPQLAHFITPERPKAGYDVLDTVADKTIPTLIRWGAGTWAVDSVVGGMGTTISSSGSSTSYISSDIESRNTPTTIQDSYKTEKNPITDVVPEPVVPESVVPEPVEI